MARWRKSSHSGAGGAECIEVAATDGRVAVRDSKDPDGPRLSLTAAGWSALLDAARQVRS